MKYLPADSTFDRIRDYYLTDEAKLSSHDEQVRRRWHSAFSKMLDEFESDIEIVKFLIEEFPISKRQAYRDIFNARALFGDVKRANKEATRLMVTEWARKLYKQAMGEIDFRGAGKALEIIVKANNLDKDDIDIPDPDKIQPPLMFLSINIDFLQSQFAQHIDESAKDEINKLIRKINQLIERSPIHNYLDTLKTIEIPHEELTDGD